MSPLHVVTGAGPVGTHVATQLAEAGHEVRVLTRSGTGPDHPRITRLRADTREADAVRTAVDGADAVFHCIHGSAYRADVWRRELPQSEQVVMDAAAQAGAVVVFPESLYAYGPVDGPMTETTPWTGTRGKLGVRAALLRARDQHRAATVSVAASDFYGPHVRNAHAGERMVPTVLSGRSMNVVGSADQPHSFTYVPDLATAMIAAAHRSDTWGSLLHAPTAPPVTQRQLVEAFAAAAGVDAPRVRTLPAWLLRAAGTVSRDARELAETSYMFTRPFVMDSGASERLLGLAPTPLADGARGTVAWWREETAQPAARGTDG